MVEPTETASSTDTIQDVSQNSSAKIFVVKGTVLSSNIEELTSAKIVEIELASSSTKSNIKDLPIAEPSAVVKTTKKKIIKETVVVKHYQPKKQTWLPLTSTQITNSIRLINHAPVPTYDFSKALLITTLFTKSLQTISFKDATDNVEIKEIIVNADYSNTFRVRPPPIFS